MPALNPDVAVIHAQQADREGNVQLWGLVGVQKEAVLAARRSIVTVEEIVDELEPRPERSRAAGVGGRRGVRGARRRPPELRDGLLERDNAFYRAWDDDLAATATRSPTWIDEHVRGTADFAEYLRQRSGSPAGAGRA